MYIIPPLFIFGLMKCQQLKAVPLSGLYMYHKPVPPFQSAVLHTGSSTSSVGTVRLNWVDSQQEIYKTRALIGQ